MSRQKGRSPAYPAVDLGTAVLRARQLYERERQHATPVETIAHHWGYKSLNGPGALALSALKKFGLLTDEGSGPERKGRLTDLAVAIIQHPSDRVRREATQEAALKPDLHLELWERYGTSLPSDQNLRWELTRERGFTDRGADEFIPQYRKTLQFAELTQSDSPRSANGPDEIDAPDRAEHGDGDSEADAASARQTSPTERPLIRKDADARGRTQTTYSIPLPKHAGVVDLTAAFPLTEAEWQYFITLLEAMKAGLVDGSGD